jgi:hypothetical protein
LFCGQGFIPKPVNPSSNGPKEKYCTPKCKIDALNITKQCENCMKSFSYLMTSQANEIKRPRRYCSVRCKMTAQRANPVSEAKYLASMQPTWDNHPMKGRPNPAAAERMKGRRLSDETREKVSRGLKAIGHKPPIRGGNGHLTVPQILLANRTGMVTELAIRTKPIRHLMENLAKHYKADLADPARMLVVEVDGSTHSSAKAKVLDAKKDKALSLLGWSVLRFSNREVMENTDSVVETIRSFMTSK